MISSIGGNPGANNPFFQRLVLDKPGAVKPVTDLLNTEVGQVSR